MRGRYPFLIVGGLACSAWGFIYRPFPLPGDDPMLDLVLYHTPNFYAWIVRWYYISVAAATANHEAAKEWDELATHADLCRADIGAGRSPRERLAEFLQPACPVLSCHTPLRVERRCKRGFLP